jgi:hypothetical protein
MGEGHIHCPFRSAKFVIASLPVSVWAAPFTVPVMGTVRRFATGVPVCASADGTESARGEIVNAAESAQPVNRDFILFSSVFRDHRGRAASDMP